MGKQAYIIIAFVTLLVFGNTLINDYNLDDELVTRNHHLTTADDKVSLYKTVTSSYAGSAESSYGYRPITLTSFWLEHRVFPETPLVSHAINLFLYGLLCLLLYKLLLLLFPHANEYLLLFITLLFAIHPIHAEVVASIKNRDEILCLMFFISAANLSQSWVSKRNILFIIGTIFLVSFSILSKKSILPITFLFPLVFLYNQKLTISSFILLSTCFSLPLALFAFDFNWVHGLLCIACFYCFHVGLYLLLHRVKRAQLNVTFLEIICGITALVCFAIAILYQEITLYSTGLLLLLLLSKNYFKVVTLVSLSISLVGYFVFNKEIFAWFYIILLSFNMYLNQNGNLKFQPKFLWLILPFVALLAYEKSDLLNLIIYSIPLVMFGSVFVDRFIPIVWSFLAVCIGVYFSAFNFFQVGLILASLLLIKQINYQKFKKGIFVLGVFFFFSFIVVDKCNSNHSLFNKRELLSQNIEDKSENSATLREGRKLEFVENSLVVAHDVDQRLATGLVVLGQYFRLMVYPKELSFYYGYSKIETTDFKDYKVWLCMLLYLSILIISVYSVGKHPLIAIGGFWYLISIALFSNIPVLVAGMVGERLAFTSSVGFCIMVGGIINWIKPSFTFKKPRLVEVFTLVILVVFSGRTIARNAKWKSHVTLMSNDIEHLHNSAQANYLLGVHITKETLNKGEPIDEMKILNGIHYFKRAIEIYPNHYNFQADLARAYIVIENYPEAKKSLIQANSLESRDLFSLEEITKISFELKEYNDAIKYGELYMVEDERKSLVYELLAYSYYFNNQPSQAVQTAQNGLIYFPTNQNLLSLIRNVK